MFGLFKRHTIAESGLLQGTTDRHSHILPGVDDGIPDMEKSLEALAEMERQGVAELWLTPHIMEDVPNTTERLRARFKELREAYAGPVRLRLAAENMLDNLFIQRWEKRDLLTMDDGKLLVETSYFNPPMEFYGILGEIINGGYRPVLAHPERYKYMDMPDYRRLRDLGILFQLNIGAIAGCYSPATRQKAEKLLAEGMYDYLGSDLHSVGFYTRALNAPLSRSVIGALEKIARP